MTQAQKICRRAAELFTSRRDGGKGFKWLRNTYYGDATGCPGEPGSTNIGSCCLVGALRMAAVEVCGGTKIDRRLDAYQQACAVTARTLDLPESPLADCEAHLELWNDTRAKSRTQVVAALKKAAQ